MAKKGVRGGVHITLRIREPLRQKLSKFAGENEISMNAEIVRRLAESFTQDDVVKICSEDRRHREMDMRRIVQAAEECTVASANINNKTADIVNLNVNLDMVAKSLFIIGKWVKEALQDKKKKRKRYSLDRVLTDRPAGLAK